jgi:polyisoprenoid-binding protein YceI
MSVSTQPFAGTYVADPAHSSIVFTVRHMKVASFTPDGGLAHPNLRSALAGIV